MFDAFKRSLAGMFASFGVMLMVPRAGTAYTYPVSTDDPLPVKVVGPDGGPETLPDLATIATVAFPMNGTSLALPAPPADATTLRFQPQDGDVRVAVNGNPASSAAGIKYAEEGIYDLRSTDWTKARFYGPAGVTVLLLWDGPQ